MLWGPKIACEESMIMDRNYQGQQNELEDLENAGLRSSQAKQEREITETEIIHRAQRRDGAAFEWLYKAHSRRVYALCLRMLGNASEAEDLTQEAFLQLFRKIHTFRGESSFSTWLHRITANLVLMRLRRKKPREVSLEGSMEFQAENGQTSKEVGQADLSLNGSIDRVCLEDAIEQLPAGYKLSIELHDIQGYKHTEIAKIMECSVGTSKAQLHRARKKLRELLREKFAWQWFPQTAKNPVPLSST
jgi:RNA polymerase sigma-70 factor, ECF subfamily